MDLWILVWMAAASSNLIVSVSLVVLAARWYRRRTLWTWFQIQLAVSLLPLSSVYFVPPDVRSQFSHPTLDNVPMESFQAENSVWTVLLTVGLYYHQSTVVAMAVHLKWSHRRPSDESVAKEMLNQRNLRLIGFSFGVPLTLSGVNSLAEELSGHQRFLSWLAQFQSASAVLFCSA